MKRFALLTTVLTAVLTLLLPFIGGSGPALTGGASYASAAGFNGPRYASSIDAPATAAPTETSIASHRGQLAKSRAATTAHLTVDTEHLGQKPVPIPVVVASPADPPAAGNPASRGGASSRTPNRGGASSAGGSTADRSAAAAAAGASCPGNGGGGGSAPGGSESGIGGTTSGDIQSFSAALNSIRAANCLQPIASGNFRYDSCMEQRLYWMAEDPSTNPGNTWGHTGVRSLAPDANGVYYSDAVPAKGCDGNLAGGSGNSGATVAQKWWDSLSHRASLYRPSVTSTAGVCIYFAMTHGGVPSENPGFARAAARWGGC